MALGPRAVAMTVPRRRRSRRLAQVTAAAKLLDELSAELEGAAARDREAGTVARPETSSARPGD